MRTDGRDQGRERWRVVFRVLLAGILISFLAVLQLLIMADVNFDIFSVNPISTGLFYLVVALGGFHPRP